jgi:hypothetical protein
MAFCPPVVVWPRVIDFKGGRESFPFSPVATARRWTPPSYRSTAPARPPAVPAVSCAPTASWERRIARRAVPAPAGLRPYRVARARTPRRAAGARRPDPVDGAGQAPPRTPGRPLRAARTSIRPGPGPARARTCGRGSADRRHPLPRRSPATAPPPGGRRRLHRPRAKGAGRLPRHAENLGSNVTSRQSKIPGLLPVRLLIELPLRPNR